MEGSGARVAAAALGGDAVEDLDDTPVGHRAVLVVHGVLGAGVVLVLVRDDLGLLAADPGGATSATGSCCWRRWRSQHGPRIRARRQMPGLLGGHPLAACGAQTVAVSVGGIDAL